MMVGQRLVMPSPSSASAGSPPKDKAGGTQPASGSRKTACKSADFSREKCARNLVLSRAIMSTLPATKTVLCITESGLFQTCVQLMEEKHVKKLQKNGLQLERKTLFLGVPCMEGLFIDENLS